MRSTSRLYNGSYNEFRVKFSATFCYAIMNSSQATSLQVRKVT